MSDLSEEDLGVKAEKFANDLAALLNQAKDDGLSVTIDTNEYDSHSVGYPIAGGRMSKWFEVRRNDDSGRYEVTR